jgi:hypothetical protein
MARKSSRIQGLLRTRTFRGAVAAGLLLYGIPKLGSESVTLATYYPAPSGVYTNMITTGNTYLARDSGNIGVRTTSPSYMLHVNGDFGAGTSHLGQTYLGGSDVYFTDTAHSHSGIGNTAGYAAIENASNYNTLMILGRSGGIGGVRSVSVWDRLDVNGALYTTGDTSVSGNSYLTGASSRLELQGGSSALILHENTCSTVVYGAGVHNCAANHYVTMTSGVMNKTTLVNNGVDPGGEMLCCPCPSGGCPGL